MRKEVNMGIGQLNLLHTPEGVRDIYNGECEKKLKVQSNIHNVLRRYGFKDIQTPTFEFFDIFNQERGTIASKEMYKFFDREGNTLVLRPDITPSIARCVAKYYKEEELPIRLCYVGNTFVNNSSYQGKLKEVTQVGAEIMNDQSSDVDAEMIALTIECLSQSGLKDFQVEVGHADFFNGLIEEANFNDEETMQLKVLIESKNLFGVEELVSSKEISPDLKELILKLPELFGDLENLTYAKTKTNNERALKAIERLEKIYENIETYGLSDYVTFDLGMLSKYNYYTGIIFKAYTYGNGEAIATGGRYDNLVQQFGKEAPAIGLAIVIDQLMLSLSRQKLEVDAAVYNTLILYNTIHKKTAIDLANHFRSNGINIELVRKSSQRHLDEYKEYSKRNEVGGILYIEDNNTIQVINISDGTTQITKLSELV
jgi:ATP phosphoribosyltransferase regulatory subunit